ncbi:MAG: hypothetical protein AB1772_07665 [Candidatus Zixiibacteriota bacterium]
MDIKLQKQLTTMSIAAGLTVGIMYPAWTFLPLPAVLHTGLWIFFGPLTLIAFIGLYPFVAKPRLTIYALMGTIFGVIGGISQTMFQVIQLENIIYIRKYIRAESDPAVQETWRHILNGVFTVQNGMNYIADLFYDLTIVMFAILMWTHPKFGKFFTITGLAAAGYHFASKLYTFPVPPHEAGLFEGGYFISIWFFLMVIQVWRKFSWLSEDAVAAVAAKM